MINHRNWFDKIYCLAIGSIVGHEITHGFDELRRHYDKHQNKYTSWSQETANIFEQRSQCLIEQYNNYFVREIGLRVNGQQTREENIADNDGLKKAFYVKDKQVFIDKYWMWINLGISKMD